MRIVRNRVFWIGFIAGTVAGPVVLSKVAPRAKAKLPAQ